MTTAAGSPPSTDDIPLDVARYARRLPPVHRLAEALLRDGGAAEKILRDATMHSESTLDWVTGVIKSVTIGAFKRPESSETTSSAGAKTAPETAEAARFIASAVLELPEPYGEAVLLRYLNLMPSRDIVARLRIPEDAVRARVKVGLTLLREELDVEHYGSRERWARFLVPLAQ